MVGLAEPANDDAKKMFVRRAHGDVLVRCELANPDTLLHRDTPPTKKSACLSKRPRFA